MTDASETRPDTRRRNVPWTNAIIIVTVVVVLFCLLIMACVASWEKANRTSCASNLSSMYTCMHVYRAAFGYDANYMPHSGDAFWTCLLGHAGPEHPESYSGQRVYSQGMAPLFGERNLYVCPSSGSDEHSVTAGGTMADYKGPARHPLVPSGNPSALVDGIPADYPIACDKPGNHKEGGGNVLLFDGSVSLREGDEYTEAVSRYAD